MSQPLQSSSSNFYPNPTPASNPNLTNALVDPYSSSANYGQFQAQYPVGPYSASATNGEFQAQYPVGPYSASATNGEFQAQPAMQLPQPIHNTFPPAVGSLTGTPSYGNSWDSQYLKPYVIETAKPANVVPTWRCEVCNVACNRKDSFDKHNQGKKHQKKLQIQARSIHNVAVDTSNATIPEELEKKKQTLLDNGAPVGSLLFCTTCNVACIDEAVFQTHLIGKKHAKQVAKQASAAAVAAAAARPASEAPENAMEVEPVKQAPQSAYCDLCHISCNSHEIFKTHLVGKRHLKNLEKLEKASSAVAAIPMENPEGTKDKGENLQESESKANPEDMEVKGENLQESESKANPEDMEVKGENLQETETKANPEDMEVKGENLQENETKVSPKDTEVEGENLQETENKAEVTVTMEEDVKNKDPKDTRSNQCEICNIFCTSPQLLEAHLQGKKHKKNVDKAKAESFIGPLVGPAAPIIGPNPEGVEGRVAEIQPADQTGAKRSRGSNEDVEIKRQKVMRGGGAPELVRVCTICNVVCSSPTVYISHLAGKKHLAVAKKATEAAISSVTA